MNDAVGPPIRILLVEDDPADAAAVVEVFRRANVVNRLDAVTDGPAALRYLRREAEFAEAPRPGLVLLDLDLPGMRGEAVLEAIRADDDLAGLPVVILTHVVEDEAILRCYDLGVRAFVAKPLEPQNVLDYMTSSDDVGLLVCERPTGS